MLTARQILAYERINFKALPLAEARDLAIETATYLDEIGLHKVELYNRLIDPTGEAFERVAEFGPDGRACLLELMAHSNPEVVKQALFVLRKAGPAEAAELARDLAGRSTTPRKVRDALKEAMRWWKFHEDHPTPAPSSSDESTTPVVEESHSGNYIHLDLAAITELARENDLEAAIPILPDVVWPSIRLLRERVAMTDLALGQSRLGGNPDMPPGMEWPRFEDNPMSLIAQIDLADLADYRSFTHLPHTGHLLFFYDTFLQSWGDDPGSWRVIHLPPGSALERRQPPDDLFENLVFHPMSLKFKPEATLAVWVNEDPTLEVGEIDEETSDALMELEETVAMAREEDSAPLHRMFGAADFVQGEFADCIADADAGENEHHRLLLQVDTDYLTVNHRTEGMFWGSGGRIYFLIGRGDLLRGCFDNVSFSLQCT